MRHQIILFIEPAKEEFVCSESIGNLYLNRFAIDEDAAHEVLGIHYLKQSSYKMCDPENDTYNYLMKERIAKERFDNKMIEQRIKDSAIVARKFSNQLHIFIAGQWYDNCYERMKHVSNVIQKYKIPPVLYNQFSLIRLGVNVLEEVESAYKNGQGIYLYGPPYHPKMTKERLKSGKFCNNDLSFIVNRILEPGIYRILPFKNSDQHWIGNDTKLIYREPRVYIQTSLLDDIEAQFDSASLTANQNLIIGNTEYGYSFLFQKLTADELRLLQKKEFKNLNKFERYHEKTHHEYRPIQIVYENVDIDETALKNSESESRYVSLYCFRMTTMLHPTKEWLNDHQVLCKQQNCLRRMNKNCTAVKKWKQT